MPSHFFRVDPFGAIVMVLKLAVVVLLASCGKPAQLRSQSETMDPRGQADATQSTSSSGLARGTDERRAQFLQRVRAADPQKATIERALLNERNELGLILNRQANLDDIPKLMKAMLAQLDQSFPGHDQTVIAYTPTDPPRVIGTARLDARTRDMTYQPASAHKQ